MSNANSSTATKKCSTCKQEKSIDSFSKKAKSKDGRNCQCKECTAKSFAEYYKSHHDLMLARAAEYRKAYPLDPAVKAARHKEYWARNTQKIAAKRRANYATNAALQKQNRDRANLWYYKNRDRQLEFGKKYYADRSDHIKALVRKYALANPEKVRAWSRVRANKRRARLLLAGGSFSAQDIAELLKLQKGKCANCHKSIKDKYHIDHRLPVAKGGSNHRHNIELLCPTCNLKKSSKWPHEFAKENGRLI